MSKAHVDSAIKTAVLRKLRSQADNKLEVMKVGGNANARNFFKAHGVSDSQMQSEKKYKTKAATEYRKHLSKLLNEDSVHHQQLGAPSGSSDAGDADMNLDRLMISVNKDKEKGGPAELQAPQTVFRAAEQGSSSVPPPPAAAASPATPTPIGMLSVKSVTSDAAAAVGGTVTAGDGTGGSTADQVGATANANAMKLLGKKGPAKAKKGGGLGARKIVSQAGGAADVRIDSFEAVERRTQQAQQEADDRSLAAQLQSQESAAAGLSSGRVAEAGKSLYRSTESPKRGGPASASSSSVYRTGGFASGPGSGYYANSASVGGKGSGGLENTFARDKYGTQKGISSDQFFGRDEEDASRARARLQQLSGSSAISSDMLSSSADPYVGQDAASDQLNRLKESVAGFFDDVQRR